MSKKNYDQYPGETNQETTDAAAKAGSDHNEAIAQRPDADADKLAQQSDRSAASLRQGEKTTTTADSASADSLDPQKVGELDTMSAEDKLKHIRGWRQRNALGGPRQADWEELDSVLGSEDDATEENRRP